MILVQLGILGFFAWLISTLAAGGGALLLIPTASFLIPMKALIPALSLASVISSLQRLYLYRQHFRWDVLRFILPGLLFGASLGTYLFSKMSIPWVSVIIAVFLFHHVWRSFKEPEKVTFKMKPIYFLPAAFLTSFLSSIAGATGPVMNPFYLNSNITKEDMIGTKAVATFFMQVFKLVGYYSFLKLETLELTYGLAIGLGALGGNIAGKELLTKMKVKTFKTVVNVFILLGAFGLLIKQF
jgi:hypothetical protein